MHRTGATSTCRSHGSLSTQASAAPTATAALSLRAGFPVLTVALAQSLALTTGFAAADSADSGIGAENEKAIELPKLSVEEKKAKSPTSPKFTEALRDTPQTIVVIAPEIYSQQAAINLSDVLRNTPGITFAAGEGGNASATAGDSFYMRGYDTTNNIFTDGVRDVGAYSRDVYNIEQVEIAKGPNGSDIGRGGASGYVNVVTKRPSLDHIVAGTVQYGTNADNASTLKRVTLDINQPLEGLPVAGTAVRLNLAGQDSGAIGRDYANTRLFGIAPSIAFGLGTKTRAYLTYQREEYDNIPDYGMPVAAFPGYTSTPMPPAIDRTNFYGFTSDYDDTTHEAATAKLEHDINVDLTISNITRFSGVQREAIVTAPGTSSTAYVPATGLLTRSRQANKRDTDILTNQTNLVWKTATGNIDHDVSTGLEITRETAYQPAFTSVTLTPIPVNQPDPTATLSATPTRSGAYTDASVDTVALYAFDTVKFSEKWHFNGGARLDHYKIDYLSFATTGIATTASAKDDVFSYKGGLLFKPVNAGTLYVAYGASYTPPGTDFALSTAAGNQNNPDTKPQKTTNIELGVKWDFFKNRLSATGSVFQQRNSRTVFTDPILGAIPAGQQTVKGLELGLSGRITNDWLIFGGISYLDAKYDTGTAAQTGATLPLTPDWSGNFWTTYRLPFGLTIGGGAQYMGEADRRDTNTTVPRTMPAYWVANAVASYPINSKISIRLNVSNLLDEEYVRSFNNNGGRFTFGSPRSYALSAEFKF